MSGLPIRSAAGFPREASKFICILKPEIHSGGVRLVLLSLKYQSSVSSFLHVRSDGRMQTETV